MPADYLHQMRAPRYAVPIPVLYRAHGERMWFEGRTENISESGVLIRSDRQMLPETHIEMLLTIPHDLVTPFSGTTICRGRIVRSIEPSGLGDRPAFAAAIQQLDMVRSDDPRRI